MVQSLRGAIPTIQPSTRDEMRPLLALGQPQAEVLRCGTPGGQGTEEDLPDQDDDQAMIDEFDRLAPRGPWCRDCGTVGDFPIMICDQCWFTLRKEPHD